MLIYTYYTSSKCFRLKDVGYNKLQILKCKHIGQILSFPFSNRAVVKLTPISLNFLLNFAVVTTLSIEVENYIKLKIVMDVN